MRAAFRDNKGASPLYEAFKKAEADCKARLDRAEGALRSGEAQLAATRELGAKLKDLAAREEALLQTEVGARVFNRICNFG
jgi:hypothetical protein